MVFPRKQNVLLPGAFLLLSCYLPAHAQAPAGLPATWRQQLAEYAKDTSLIRFYGFDEGKGDNVREAAGKGNDLNIGMAEPYFNESLAAMGKREEPPFWTTGRWPGKSALTITSGKKSIRQSRFYGVPKNVLSVETWVRLHADPKTAGGSTLISIGSGYDNGWRLTTDGYSTSFGLGRPPGTGPGKGFISVSGGALTPNVWHQVVAVLDGENKAISIYIDGVLSKKQDFDGIYTQMEFPAGNEKTPELDRGGLTLGATDSFPNKNRFDVDEVAIYDRALPAEVIAARFKAGNPPESPADQAKAHQALVAHQAAMELIKFDLGTTTGYLPQGTPITVAIDVPAAAKLNGAYKLVTKVTKAAGAPVWQGSSALQVGATGAKSTVTIPVQPCGLYDVQLTVQDAKGGIVKSVSLPVGVRRPQLPVRQMPVTAPLAHFGATYMHQEDLGLGGNFERIIHPWCPLSKDGGYDWTYPDLYVKTALDQGLVPFYTIMSPMGPKGFTSFKDMADDPVAWEKWVRELATHFKGKVNYWEVLNEPNAGGHVTPSEYVTLLKVAFKVLKEVDPNNKVIGIGGTANFAEWTEDVLAAGAGPYLDIVCFHNYIGTSPINGWNKYKKVDRVRAAVLKYVGKPLPLWNGECGMHHPVRVNGRPMTDAELIKAYPGRSRVENGWAMAGVDAIMMTTEHRNACWQVQSILQDLAAGAEKYFLLMGSGHFYPYQLATQQGYPTEKGLALAAMSSVTTTMSKIRFIPLSSSDAMGMMVTDKNGKNTAVFFADRKMTLPLNLPGKKTYKAMDYLGNPLTVGGKQDFLSLAVADEPVYLLDVPADLAENRLLTVKTFPAQVAPGQTVQGELSVTNTTGKPLKGTLSITASGTKIAPVPALTLAPNGQKVVPFTVVAGQLERGQHTLSAQLIQDGTVLSRGEQIFGSEGVATGVPLGPRAIQLDADGADWAGIPSEKADQPGQVVIGRPDVGVADARWWQGPKDLSFDVKSAWRPNDGIYLLINVTDNNLTVAPEGKQNLGYMWDCLELFFDGRALENQATTYSVGAEQIVVVPNITDATAPCRTVNFARSTPTLDVEFVGKKTANGYIMEGRIKPRANGPLKLETGTRFGMDVTFDDADGGQRRVQMAMHGSEKNSFDTSQWGRYQLQSK